MSNALEKSGQLDSENPLPLKCHLQETLIVCYSREARSKTMLVRTDDVVGVYIGGS